MASKKNLPSHHKINIIMRFKPLFIKLKNSKTPPLKFHIKREKKTK